MLKFLRGFILPVLIVLILVIACGLVSYPWWNKVIGDISDDEISGTPQDPQRTTMSIVGTGTDFNSGIISTTSPPTIFQFASSTAETFWDTNVVSWPHLYGATTTVYITAGKATLISFNGVFKGQEPVSSFTLELSGSNDPAANQTPVTSNTANWYPVVMTKPTTTPVVLDSLFTETISPGSTASTSFAFAIDDINYDYYRLRAYNGSTTDESLLFMEVTIKE